MFLSIFFVMQSNKYYKSVVFSIHTIILYSLKKYIKNFVVLLLPHKQLNYYPMFFTFS